MQAEGEKDGAEEAASVSRDEKVEKVEVRKEVEEEEAGREVSVLGMPFVRRGRGEVNVEGRNAREKDKDQEREGMGRKRRGIALEEK